MASPRQSKAPQDDLWLRRTEAWFPWVQRAVVLLLGAGGFVYATVSRQYEVFGASAPLILWGGYQELRRADRRQAASRSSETDDEDDKDDPLEGW